MPAVMLSALLYLVLLFSLCLVGENLSKSISPSARRLTLVGSTLCLSFLDRLISAYYFLVRSVYFGYLLRKIDES